MRQFSISKNGLIFLLIVIFLPLGINAIEAKETGIQQQSSLKTAMQRGKKVYESTCLTCHQADGSGVAKLNPPLIKTDYVTGDPGYLINILLKGLNDEIEINGEYYGNPMPAQAHLTDHEIADVLTFIRNSFGNKGTVVTSAMVASERKKIK